MSQDSGAVAVVVALTATAMFGMGALAIDIARLHQERRDLQNGADAAALAVAQSCAVGACADGAANVDMSQFYADTNARDFHAVSGEGGSNVKELCINGLVVPDGSACTDPPSTFPGNGYVQVSTRTGTEAGEGIVPPVLAELLAGDVYQGTVNARAIAAWGPAGSATSSLPITLDACEWAAYTDGGTDFAPPPPYDDGYPVDDEGLPYEQTFYLKEHPKEAESLPACSHHANYQDSPGGFGYVTEEEADDDCSATTDEDSQLYVDTAVNVPKECPEEYLESLVPSTIYVPVFSVVSGTGGNAVYTIEGYAAFYLTGLRLSPKVAVNPPCGGGDRCISGFFTSAILPAAGWVGSGTDMGLTVIQLVPN